MAKHEHLSAHEAADVIKGVKGVDAANVDQRLSQGEIGAFIQIPGPHPTVSLGMAADGSYWVEVPDIVVEPTS